MSQTPLHASLWSVYAKNGCYTRIKAVFGSYGALELTPDQFRSRGESSRADNIFVCKMSSSGNPLSVSGCRHTVVKIPHDVVILILVCPYTEISNLSSATRMASRELRSQSSLMARSLTFYVDSRQKPCKAHAVAECMSVPRGKVMAFVSIVFMARRKSAAMMWLLGLMLGRDYGHPHVNGGELCTVSCYTNEIPHDDSSDCMTHGPGVQTSLHH